MYAKYSDIISVGGMPQNAYQFKLKQHHHMHIDREFKLDCEVWIQFLNGELENVMNRPMIDLLKDAETSEDISFYSDASAAEDKGFGAILKNRWIHVDWSASFIQNKKPSIKFLELFVLCMGLLTWNNTNELKNRRVILHCDNQAVCQMINTLMSGCNNCLNLIKIIILDGLKWNLRISARYITSKNNYLSDALSHGEMGRFCRLGPTMKSNLDPISETIWPVDKIWLD